MAGSKNSKTEGLVYKGHPLRRAGNLIYYGTMAEKYIIMMQVLETKRSRTWTWPPRSPSSSSSRTQI